MLSTAVDKSKIASLLILFWKCKSTATNKVSRTLGLPGECKPRFHSRYREKFSRCAKKEN